MFKGLKIATVSVGFLMSGVSLVCFAGVDMVNAAPAKQGASLDAAALLAKQGQAAAFIFQTISALPPSERGRSAPLIKALAETTRAVKLTAKAAAARDRAALSESLPRLAAAIASVDVSFRLSGIKSKAAANGVETLRTVFDDYMRRTAGGSAAKGSDLAKKNGLRIAAMQRRLDVMAHNAALNARQKEEIARLRRQLDAARANNQNAARQWQAIYEIAAFNGAYSALYGWYSAYEPTQASVYRDDWGFVSHLSSKIYSDNYFYYNSYNWNQYNEPVVYNEVYNFGLSSDDYAAFELNYSRNEDAIDTSIDEDYRAEAASAAIDQAETQQDSATFEDPADSEGQDGATTPDDASDSSATAPDDGNDQSAAPGDSDNDSAAGSDDAGSGQDNATAPDDGNDQSAQPADEGGGDSGAADDGGSGDAGGGDGG